MITSKRNIGVKPKKKASKNILAEKATSEDILQRQIVAKLRAHDAFVILTDAVGPALKYMTSNTQRLGFISWSKARGWEKGVPDLLVIWKGNVLFLELKFGKQGKLSVAQEAWKNRIISHGYDYACWRTLKECEDWILSKLNKDNNN